MGDGAVAHGINDAHHVGDLSLSLVQPSSAAVLAVPVLNVTVLVAGSLNSVNVLYRVSSVGVGQLVADHAVLIAGIGVLVLASGLRTVNGDGDGLPGVIVNNVTVAEDVLLVVVDNVDIIGAGGGIVLYLEGNGVEQVGLNSLSGSSGSAQVLHQAALHITGFLIDRREQDVLIAGGTELGAYLDGGHPHFFVLIIISDQLKNSGVKTQLKLAADQAQFFVAVQGNFYRDFIAGVNLLCIGNQLNIVVTGSGNGSERNHATQQKRRQQNC